MSTKVLFLAFAVVGVAAGAGAVNSPMMKAIQIHEDHLGADSTMPDQAIQGQQNSLDRLMDAQERWLAGNHTMEDEPEDDNVVALA